MSFKKTSSIFFLPCLLIRSLGVPLSIIEPLLTTQWFVDSKKLCKDVKKIIKKNEFRK